MGAKKGDLVPSISPPQREEPTELTTSESESIQKEVSIGSVSSNDYHHGCQVLKKLETLPKFHRIIPKCI